MIPRAVVDKMAVALRALPCRCQLEGKAMWHLRAQPIVEKMCSRCAALVAYDDAVMRDLGHPPECGKSTCEE